MIHAITVLAYRRLGVPAPPVHSMLEGIRTMKHVIRTAYGLSALTLTSEGYLIPYQGLLQGNGASPTSWVIISAPMIEMMRAAGNGGHFASAISNQRSHVVGFAFVDDTDLIQMRLDDNTILKMTLCKRCKKQFINGRED